LSPRPSSYDLIIDAAEAVVAEVGAAHLTLDTVAAKAKVSKGGLMYHFPDKDSLLRAMVAHLIERFSQIRNQAQAQAKVGNKPADMLKIHTMTTLSQPKKSRLAAAILAAAANEPKLLAPLRDYYARRFVQFEAAGLSFEDVAIVVLATSGLSMFEQLRISPFNNRQRKRIIAKLMNLIENSSRKK
jgi:AcrR family transcriptional regulator